MHLYLNQPPLVFGFFSRQACTVTPVLLFTISDCVDNMSMSEESIEISPPPVPASRTRIVRTTLVDPDLACLLSVCCPSAVC